MSRSVLLTEPRDFSPQALDILRRGGFDPRPFKGELSDLKGSLAGQEGVIVRLGIRWTRELLGAESQLKFIGTPTTGLDHIDLEAARKRGIDVISLRGLEGIEEITSTVEHTFGLLLALVRRTCPAHLSVLEGAWDRDAFVGRELRGRLLGIVGMGRLGRGVAAIARVFRMNVIYYDPLVDLPAFERCPSLKDLARRAEIISLHAKLTVETRAMIGPDFFDSCRRGLYLVNTSRGDLVDEDALLQALEKGVLAGAALDVLRDEPEKGTPFPSPVIEYARRHDNVLITPHVGGASSDAMRATEVMIAEEIVRRHGS